MQSSRVARAVALPAVFALGVGVTLGLRGNAGENAIPDPPLHPSAQALDVQSSFEQVAEKFRPSVVFIRSRQTMKLPTGFRQGSDDGDDNASPFGLPQIPGFPGGGQQFRFFGPGGPGQQHAMPLYPHHAEASGSGVIVRSDGYILTNDHVIQGADKVTVRLQDGREFIGKVIPDFRSDLALVKINATGLPAAQMADSDKVKVGQWAIAFGAPFGLSDTMTVGVVSSLNREEQIGEGAEGRFYPRLIQTDASINPGNSGGPLVDIYGRVIGINVAIESPSGANAGVGFTIPSNTASYIVDQLMTKGSVTRGYLGLAPNTLNYDQQQQYGVKEGALVSSISDGTPAAKAGFQVGDVIVRYNGQPIADDATLRDLVARTKPGDTIPVVVRRDGQDHTLNVTVGAAPDLQAAAPKSDNNPLQQNEAPPTRSSSKLGVRVADPNNADVREQLHLKGDLHGAVIVEVTPGSPASEAGLQPGDVIEQINGKSVTSASQLSDLVRGIKTDSASLSVRRGSQVILVNVDFN